MICIYGPADATATLSSVASLKSRIVYLPGAGLPGLCWKKGRYMEVIALTNHAGTSHLTRYSVLNLCSHPPQKILAKIL